MSALLQAIPGPVAGVFVFFLIVLLFAHGIRLIVSDGFSFDSGIVFGVSLWAGYGFQSKLVFHDLMPSVVSQLLDNGMTTGGITAVLLSFILTFKQSRAYRITLPANVSSLREMVAFARDRGETLGWRGADLSRLELALEEAFLYQAEKAGEDSQYKIRLLMRSVGEKLELEFVSSPSDENIEDLLRVMQPVTDFTEGDVRLRILSNMVDEISHKQFNQQDFLGLMISQKTPNKLT